MNTSAPSAGRRPSTTAAVDRQHDRLAGQRSIETGRAGVDSERIGNPAAGHAGPSAPKLAAKLAAKLAGRVEAEDRSRRPSRLGSPRSASRWSGRHRRSADWRRSATLADPVTELPSPSTTVSLRVSVIAPSARLMIWSVNGDAGRRRVGVGVVDLAELGQRDDAGVGDRHRNTVLAAVIAPALVARSSRRSLRRR